MDTKNLQDLLVDYLYEELPPEQRAEYEAALRESPDLQEEIEALQRTREAFAALDELEVPAAISDRLLAEAARAVPEQPSFLQRLRSALQLLVLHPAMSAAVVMVAVLGVSFYVYRHGAPPSALPQADPLRPLPAAPPSAPLAQAETGAKAVAGNAAAEGLRGRRAGDLQGGKATTRQQKQGKLAQAAQVAGSSGSSATGRGQTGLTEKPKQQGYARPFRRARARGAKRSMNQRSMDGLGNTATDRRERRDYKSKGLDVDRNQAAPQSIAPRPKARRAPVKTPTPAKKTSARRPTTAGTDKEAEASRGWLRLGHQAATANRCAVAFDYYTRALRAEPSLLAQISARLGGCRGELRRSAAHRWLAARIHGQERRPARRKAKRRVLSPQQRLESK